MTGGAAKHGFRSPVRALDGILPYHQQWLSKDILAGVTLAALAIPEVMGYTKIAGTPVITGLYTILIPIAAFALFGSSRHLVVGGDSATAAIMYAGHRRARHLGPPAQHASVARARGRERLLAAGLPLWRGGAGRVPAELPFPDGAGRLPHRCRHPGGDGAGRGMLGIPPPDVSRMPSAGRCASSAHALAHRGRLVADDLVSAACSRSSSASPAT